jgi:hypothetical protein
MEHDGLLTFLKEAGTGIIAGLPRGGPASISIMSCGICGGQNGI